MTFKQTYETITSSEIFRDFKKQFPEAEFCTGFFITDFFGNDNKKSIDFKVGEKIFTFSINELGNLKMNEDELIKTKQFPTLEPINPEFKVDLDEAESTAKIKAVGNGINAKFSKIISVLQKYEGKQVWNLTCMLEGLIILHVIIDANTGEVIKFERKSMMDLIRKK
ncbi:MAG: hypothetical protein PHF67_04140 [Candidatus Nanoarchaeia archaeon]|nr:hypothetical protein [Candidatus Nanoarchaeia archaeon]